ncbi:MAG: DUF5329 domain-containing protein [Pseudomonadota bacterium]
MKTLIFVGAMLAASGALAKAPEATRAEVAHLMAAVEKSQCKFNRNGSWHEAKAAREHLEKKFDYLDKRDMVTTAESFIARGASTSSMSGKAYEMQCGTAKAVTSSAWLTEELNRYRKAK